jgi:hypothetical protein
MILKESFMGKRIGIKLSSQDGPFNSSNKIDVLLSITAAHLFCTCRLQHIYEIADKAPQINTVEVNT